MVEVKSLVEQQATNNPVDHHEFVLELLTLVDENDDNAA